MFGDVLVDDEHVDDDYSQNVMIVLPKLAWDHEDPLWLSLAACQDMGLPHDDVFFNNNRTEEAKAVCSMCPSRPECLEFAIMNAIPFGVWGGLDQDELKAARRDR
jgi:WhiB family redox-sensing transcriptional regulator